MVVKKSCLIFVEQKSEMILKRVLWRIEVLRIVLEKVLFRKAEVTNNCLAGIYGTPCIALETNWSGTIQKDWYILVKGVTHFTIIVIKSIR